MYGHIKGYTRNKLNFYRLFTFFMALSEKFQFLFLINKRSLYAMLCCLNSVENYLQSSDICYYICFFQLKHDAISSTGKQPLKDFLLVWVIQFFPHDENFKTATKNCKSSKFILTFLSNDNKCLLSICSTPKYVCRLSIHKSTFPCRCYVRCKLYNCFWIRFVDDNFS